MSFWAGAQRASALHQHLTARQSGDARGIKLVLRLLNARVQSFRSVGIQHRHRFLAQDRPGINTGIDQMDGATGHFNAVIESLFPCFQTRERRQERGVDIDDAAFEGAEERAFKDAHKTGEHNQVCLSVLERFDEGEFGFVIEFGAEFAGGDVLCGNREALGFLKNAGIWHIAEHNGDLGRHGAIGAAAGQRIEVRAFAGAEHGETEMISRMHQVRMVLRVKVGDKYETSIK
jgi:hypothetical protein